MVLMFRSARRLRRPSQFREMVARSAYALRRVEEQVGVGRLVRGVVAGVVAWILAPSLICSYIVVSACRVMWCRLLERRFPGVEPDRSPSVRAATDTRRNQGVVTMLLHVKGRCDVNLIRRRVQAEILDRRNENGELQFPRLQAALTSRWGHYAWRQCSENEFRLDSHVVVGSQLFRGRAVTDANIQDYISDIVSKFLPAEIPPWQIVLVPVAAVSTAQPRFYVLLRLHHLLVDEVSALHALLRGNWGWGPPLVPRTRAVPFLISMGMGSARSTWMQLRHRFDPAFNPKVLKDPTVTTITLVLVFVAADIVDQVVVNRPWYTRVNPFAWITAVRTQMKKRHLSSKILINQVFTALSPLNFTGECVRTLVWLGVQGLRLPFVCLDTYRSDSSRHLGIEATCEVLYWLRVALDAPRLVIGELYRSLVSSPPPQVSLCGRRVVAWSDPTPVALVERIAEQAGVAPVEILLAASCAALKDHYRRQGCETPAIPVQPLGFSGLLLLPPPPSQDDDPLASLRAINHRLADSRHQPALLLASSWLRRHLSRLLPSLSVRLLLNCVTRRYAAIIMTAAPQVLREGPITIWNYEVDSVLLWRPPQANISVSLSLVRIGNNVRLAVMADQQLWPHHAALPSAFLSHLRAIGVALGVPRTPPASPGPSADVDGEPSPELLRREEELLED